MNRSNPRQQEQRDASDDYNDIGSALPRGFNKTSNDTADQRRLYNERRAQHQHDADMRSFYKSIYRTFDTIHDFHTANDVLDAHPILAHAFHQNKQEYPAHTNYEPVSSYDYARTNIENEHDEPTAQLSSYYTTCIQCDKIFPCSSAYHGNRPICMTCSAEMQDARNDDITTSGSPPNLYSRSASPALPNLHSSSSRSASPASMNSPLHKRQRSLSFDSSDSFKRQRT